MKSLFLKDYLKIAYEKGQGNGAQSASAVAHDSEPNLINFESWFISFLKDEIQNLEKFIHETERVKKHLEWNAEETPDDGEIAEIQEEIDECHEKLEFLISSLKDATEIQYSISVTKLIERPIIRDDFEEEWMNKMTDDEIAQWHEEAYAMCKADGLYKTPEINACHLAKHIDRGILYKLFKMENGRQ